MNVLELFSGTGSVGKVCKEYFGWNVFSIDRDLPADLNIDIMNWDYKNAYPKDHFDIIFASPPCHTFSHLQNSWIGRMRQGEMVTRETIIERQEKEGLPLLRRVQEIIEWFNPMHYVIENPNTSRMKNYIDSPHTYVIDYCRYVNWGYKKRTRFWTDIPNFQPKLCEHKCGQIVECTDDEGKIHNYHKRNLGNMSQLKLTGTTHIKREDAYRIPPQLIKDLFEAAFMNIIENY